MIIDEVGGDPAANGTFKIGNVSRYTFDLFDAATGTMPIAPSGAYTTGGRWSYPLHPYVDTGDDLTKVFYRVTGDDPLGTFQGTFVSVNGVDRTKTTGSSFESGSSAEQNVGRLLLDADLTDADGTPLPAGTYNFTFFGVAETATGLGGGPPFSLGAIREDIREEINRIRRRLHRLEKATVTRKNRLGRADG